MARLGFCLLVIMVGTELAGSTIVYSADDLARDLADSSAAESHRSTLVRGETRTQLAVEPEPRFISWPTLERLALEAGVFLPPFGPVSLAELVDILRVVAADTGSTLNDPAEQVAYRSLRLNLDPYGEGAQPADFNAGIRLGLGAELDYAEYGDVLEDGAGLDLPTGWTVQFEPGLTAWRDRWWFSVTPRLRGRLDDPQRLPPPELLYQDWNRATGRLAVGDARLDRTAWRVDWPRVVAGIRLGRWSLTAGVDRRWLGPGLGGGLELSRAATVFPAVTLRRMAPFRWRGFMRHVAPVNLLLRVGSLSPQDIVYFAGDERVQRRDRPWFFQWLLTFQHTSWLRTTVISSAMAVAREGSLWPDLLQINFPLLSATPAEVDRGPVTDRIFALQFEARFRHAPWPLLPSAAGRLYWEYGGEDFIPLDELDFIPRISAPASVAGIELVSPRWDLAVEYAELVHPSVLWYSHSNFQEGYSQRGRVLGHPLGGSGESLRGWLRWRPRGNSWQVTAGASHSTWGTAGLTPGRARRNTIKLVLQRTHTRTRWQLGGEWNAEQVTPFNSDQDGDAAVPWSRAWLRFTY